MYCEDMGARGSLGTGYCSPARRLPGQTASLM